jgi:hypothetical protein
MASKAPMGSPGVTLHPSIRVSNFSQMSNPHIEKNGGHSLPTTLDGGHVSRVGVFPTDGLTIDLANHCSSAQTEGS